MTGQYIKVRKQSVAALILVVGAATFFLGLLVPVFHQRDLPALPTVYAPCPPPEPPPACREDELARALRSCQVRANRWEECVTKGTSCVKTFDKP